MENLFRLKLKDLGKLPESIMLVDEEAREGTGNYSATETFRVTDFLDNEIAEIRNRGGYHTVYVYGKKERKMNKVTRILMERDGMTREEAEDLIDECREALLEGDQDAIEYYLGLEEDYIFDILL